MALKAPDKADRPDASKRITNRSATARAHDLDPAAEGDLQFGPFSTNGNAALSIASESLQTNRYVVKLDYMDEDDNLITTVDDHDCPARSG